MKRTTGKLLWAGFSHFVVGLCVVDLALMILVAVVGALFEIRWLMLTIVGVMVVVPPFMAIRAVRKEMVRQKLLGLGDVPGTVCDPVLGELRRAEADGEMWEATVSADGSVFTILVHGEGLPDPSQLAKAREIARNASEFLRSVSESKERLIPLDPFFVRHRDEIRALLVESVVFGRAGRSENVEVYFECGSDERCWRGHLSGFCVDALGCET